MNLNELDELRSSDMIEKTWVFKGDRYKFTSHTGIISRELEEIKKTGQLLNFLLTAINPVFPLS